MHFATVKTYENIHKQTGNIQICHCAYSPGQEKPAVIIQI